MFPTDPYLPFINTIMGDSQRHPSLPAVGVTLKKTRFL